MALTSDERLEIAQLVTELRRGDGLTQTELDRLAAAWQMKAAPDAKERTEHFSVVRPDGTETGLVGPRWAFHLFGLRHRAVHVALRTEGGLLLLQRRSPSKADWPDALDMTAAGHIPHYPGGASLSWEAGAWKEIAEEVGLCESDAAETLKEGRLIPVGEPYFALDRDAERVVLFTNAEVRRIFIATVTGAGFARLHFADSEAAAFRLASPDAAWQILLTENIASGLRYSLPRVLDWLEKQ